MAKRRRVKVISEKLTTLESLRIFLSVHWRGVVVFIIPIVCLAVVLPLPTPKHNIVAYALLNMAIFWVSECIPIPVTGLIPVVIFPLTDILTTLEVSRAYMNDSIIMFIGSLYLAYSIEQSGVHKRLAYFSIRIFGYSHYKILLAVCIVTTFASLWITNTAATTMMVPIIFALLKVFEDQKVLTMYEPGLEGEEQASDLTACYFCAATFSATIGGIGTLTATATNLVFKGLFIADYPDAPDYLSFPLFSAFSFPLMCCLEAATYFSLITLYFGFLRPNSAAAQKANITPEAQKAAKIAVTKNSKALGSIRFHEMIVVLLFGMTMAGFFCRSPQIFTGWADVVNEFNGRDRKFILDSAVCILFCVLMMSFPSTLMFFRNCTAKYTEDMPKRSLRAVLDWPTLNRIMPYSFMLLLGGGFGLSLAAKLAGLNDKLGEHMESLKDMPLPILMLLIIILIVILTNLASNVAVANVLVPILMSMAKKIGQHPLLFCIIPGYCASFTFLLPVGTPGNLIVQGAAKIPTRKMIIAGVGPSIAAVLLSWCAFTFWGPVIWPDLRFIPDWAKA